ncbi:MAG: FUSC family protein [Sulfurovum sp.]|nr:FUSC family protein [Sulfurovum sp.]
MESSTKEVKSDFLQELAVWFSFGLSDKMKFAIKAALSIVLVHLICFAMGWTEARTAAITILIIVSGIQPGGSSSNKAFFRVMDTLIGATVGLTLIGLFPQDRFAYLASVSIAIMFFAYLSSAYKGGTRIFMLSALTLLLMFDNGEIDDVFTYGIGRVTMILLGILIYTLVSVFLWPERVEENSMENALSMTSIETDLYLQRDGEREKRKELYQKMLSQEALLSSSNLGISDATGEMGFTTTQWNSIVHNYKKINEIITLFAYHDKTDHTNDPSHYVTNYQEIEEEILGLFKAVSLAWQEKKEIHIPTPIEPLYQFNEVDKLSHLDHARLVATIGGMQKLHTQLCKLAEKLNSLISPKPTHFALEDIPRRPFFLWFDIENLKAALLTFLVFWTSTLIWIFINPPGSLSYGFDLVTFATAVSIITIYLPVNPLKMIFIFSFSFVFAASTYIFVLPHLHEAWEISLFIFIYAFIGFYFFNRILAIFFLLGLFTLDIQNTMVYSFDILAGTFFIMFAFLFILLFFYYIPFSTKPEYLFLKMKRRFFKLSQILLHRGHHINMGKRIVDILAAKNSKIHLMNTVKKMQLWTGFIDTKYFNTIDKKQLLHFGKECESFVYLLKMMHHKDRQMRDNSIFKIYRSKYNEAMLADLLEGLALGVEERKAHTIWSNEKHVIKHIEDNLEHILSEIKDGEYSRKDIIEFYENVNLRKNVWLSLFGIQKMMSEIDFKALEMNRF